MAATKISWADWWALFNAMPDGTQRRFSVEQLGLFDGDFDHWMRSRSADVIVEVIHDAPIEIVVLYLCLLPKKRAQKEIDARPQSDAPRLIAAYYNPPKLLTGGR